MLFCGSYPDRINEQGPECKVQMPAWVPGINDNYEIQYPGLKWGQAQDALAKGIPLFRWYVTALVQRLV